MKKSLLFIYDDVICFCLGRKSKESYNGIYIQNGKKIIKKKK